LGLRPCLRQSSSTINSWWRTWLSWSSCRPNLQHEFAALKVLHKVFHVGWTDLRLASTTALTTSAATATRLFLSTALHSVPPTWSERLVQVQLQPSPRLSTWPRLSWIGLLSTSRSGHWSSLSPGDSLLE